MAAASAGDVVRLVPGAYTGGIASSNSGGASGRINILGSLGTDTTDFKNYTFTDDIDLSLKDYVTVRGVYTTGGIRIAGNSGGNAASGTALRDSVAYCIALGGLELKVRADYASVTHCKIGDSSNGDYWNGTTEGYASGVRSRSIEVSDNVFGLATYCGGTHILSWSAIDSAQIYRNKFNLEVLNIACSANVSRFTLRFNCFNLDQRDNRYNLTNNSNDSGGSSGTIFYYRDGSQFCSHVRDTVLDLHGLNQVNMEITGSGNESAQRGYTFTNCVFVAKGSIYFQFHAPSSTFNGNVLVSQGKPFQILDSAGDDSLTFTHNTVISLGGDNCLNTFASSGSDGRLRTSTVRNNLFFKSGDNSTLLFSQGGLFTPITGDTCVNYNLWHGSTGGSTSQMFRYYDPCCGSNYGGPGTTNSYINPEHGKDKAGNPLFACTVIGNTSFTAAAQMDTIVSWIQRGQNPFKPGANGNAVNFTQFDNSLWTWPDGYVGAIAPPSTAKYIFADNDTTTSADGSYTKPWSLATAMALAAAGDTVRLLDGNYAGDGNVTPVNAGTAGSPIVIIGTGAANVRVDSIMIKTAHVIVDSMTATHGEILRLGGVDVSYSKIRYCALGSAYMSGASHSKMLGITTIGPVKVLGTNRAGLAAYGLARNGEAYKDTLQGFSSVDTVTASANHLFNIQYANQCLFSNLSVRGTLNGTVDTIDVRKIGFSYDNHFVDNTWHFTALAAGASQFALQDSSSRNLFERESWHADSSGVYRIVSYLSKGATVSNQLVRNTYRDCTIKSTGSNYLSGVTSEFTADSTLFYSRIGTGLIISGDAWSTDIQFCTIRGANVALNSTSGYWFGGTLQSNIFVADTLADSSGACVKYEISRILPYQWNYNAYFVNRFNASAIKDSSAHAVHIDGVRDSSFGAGPVPIGVNRPMHCKFWGGLYDGSGFDCSSVFGAVAFTDTIFATYTPTLAAGSVAKRYGSNWPLGYAGSESPRADVTPPDDVSDLAGLLGVGGPTPPVYLTWTEVGDDGSTGRAYIAYVAHEQTAHGGVPTLSSTTFEGFVTGTLAQPLALPGVEETLTVSNAYGSSGNNYYMVKVCDGAGNCSYSNLVGPL